MQEMGKLKDGINQIMGQLEEEQEQDLEESEEEDEEEEIDI